MLEKLGIKYAVWKLKGYLENKKTYTVAAAAAALGVALLSGQDPDQVIALLQEGKDADPAAVLTVLFGLGLAALKAGFNRAAAKQEAKLDALAAAVEEKK